MELVHADSEKSVIDTLSNAGYWDDPACWRDLGDNENNFSVVGSQQSKSDAALVEKLINAVDSRLMDECQRAGIRCDDAAAPNSIREAVARFIEKNPSPESETAGRVSNWTQSERTKVARDITLAATGSKREPSFTIFDKGEGQTPDNVPNTFLSLNKSNKLKIPFVQGKFNMGGTGVLRFCGTENIQLILTRRDPSILPKDADDEDRMWSFTVVRRENPRGNERSSVYRYLAPLNSGSGRGILRFKSDKLAIVPERNDPYSQDATHGSLIKLYDYAAQGFRSNILMRDGLLSRVELLIPEPALPIRFHECRDYKGGPGSFDTTVTGVGVRLEDDRASNLEEGFPVAVPFSAEGEKLVATVYAFKSGKAETYKKLEGVIFVLNGQTHGNLTTNFFRQKSVGLSYLANSLLVKIDCSQLSKRAVEDLFMNSRDRLSDDAPLKKEIVTNLADILKSHEGLRDLKNRRREEEIAERLEENKPLAETLESILKSSPTLSAIFLQGSRLSNAFKIKQVSEEARPFKGLKFPTYFHFKGKKPGGTFSRDCSLESKCRVQFETDAANDYFGRSMDIGTFDLFHVDGSGSRVPVSDYVGPNLSNGLATLSFELPDNAVVGDVLNFVAVINDVSQVKPFENELVVKVRPKAGKKGKPGKRKEPPSEKPGVDRDLPAGLSLPNIIEVKEEEWESGDRKFDKFTALQVINASEQVPEGKDFGHDEDSASYDFYINVDNHYLKRELKSSKTDEKLVRSQFIYGMVLVGLAILHDTSNGGQGASNDDVDEDATPAEDTVEAVTRAIAPFLVPMIESLGGLEVDEDTPDAMEDQAA